MATLSKPCLHEFLSLMVHYIKPNKNKLSSHYYSPLLLYSRVSKPCKKKKKNMFGQLLTELC